MRNACLKLALYGCVVSVCCVGFDVGILICSSFLISGCGCGWGLGVCVGVCMFIVSKALLISSATVIVRAGGAIWLNPFATVLFSMCSSVTVECCVLYPCCVGVFVGMFSVM